MKALGLNHGFEALGFVNVRRLHLSEGLHDRYRYAACYSALAAGLHRRQHKLRTPRH